MRETNRSAFGDSTIPAELVARLQEGISRARGMSVFMDEHDADTIQHQLGFPDSPFRAYSLLTDRSPSLFGGAILYFSCLFFLPPRRRVKAILTETDPIKKNI